MTFQRFLDQEIARAGGVESLADLLDVTTTTIYRYRLGQILPRADLIERLAQVTGMPVWQIVHMVYAVELIKTARARARKPLARVPRPAPIAFLDRSDIA